MPESNKIVLVLGAHRSGTSLAAAGLQAIGVDLGLADQYTNEENPKGFFEHPGFVAFNDRLLAHLGGSWDNPVFNGAHALRDAAATLADWRTEAGELIQALVTTGDVYALKDPRLCQLLPFWLQVLHDRGYRREQIQLLYVHRDPVEVALSQQSRALANPEFYEFGRQLQEGAALWLSLSGQALVASQGHNVLYVTFASLMAGPDPLLRRIADWLSLPTDPAKLSQFAQEFVEPELHRSRATSAAREEIARALPEALEFDQIHLEASRPSVDDAHATSDAIGYFAREATQHAIARASVTAFSRLADGTRQARLESRQRREVTVNLAREVAERKSMLVPLRNQIFRLEEGVAELQASQGAQAAEIVRLSGELREIGNEKIRLHDTLEAMYATLSWRITRPVRRLRTAQLAFVQWLRSTAARSRLRGIYTYHRLSVRHPGLAWVARRGIRPFFQLLNLVLPGYAREAYRSRMTAEDEIMRYQFAPTSDTYRPLVSIIVPNYNHAQYLEMRLDSIYSQTYGNYEVILLDDASTDESRSVLQRYQSAHPDNTRLLVNEKNSGGAFHQWTRGLQEARGELVWIAESDDWCTEDFLDSLVPYFANEAIQLAYARTVFMEGDSGQETWSIHEYLHDIDPDRWSHAFIDTSHRLVADAFAVKNIIPNVSSAVFRNCPELELLSDDAWKSMRTCGDWVFYLHLLRGGLLAYSPKACNYYRMHPRNTSVASHRVDQFYAEHEVVAKVVGRYYRVDPAVFSRLRDLLMAHWRQTRGDLSVTEFEKCFSVDRILSSTGAGKAPNLLMASYGFCAGGGETFPVQLANLMKSVGYNVTYLDCGREPRIDAVRLNLRSDIPVVSDFTQLQAIADDFGIDIIHSHHAWVDGTIFDLLPADHPSRIVVTLHGMYETINDYDLRSVLPRLVDRTAMLIYVADKNLTALRRHNLLGDARLKHIGNALYHIGFQAIDRSEFGISADAFVMTLVSRAMEEKGWSEAIRIAQLATAQSRRSIHLLLVGDGAEQERLSMAGVPDNVHLLGFQSNVRGYFAMSDIGILPSRFRGESSPLVLIECLQAGRPFLASRLGEVEQMLASPTGPAGLLFDLEDGKVDVERWAQAVVRLAENQAEYMALKANVPTAAHKFDPGILADKHDEAYRAAIACA